MDKSWSLSHFDQPQTPRTSNGHDQLTFQSPDTGHDGGVVCQSSSDRMTPTIHTGDIDRGPTDRSRSDQMAAAILRSLAGEITGHDMTGRSPSLVRSGHMTGRSPVRSFMTGPVQSPSPVRSGLVRSGHRSTVRGRHRSSSSDYSSSNSSSTNESSSSRTTRVSDHVVKIPVSSQPIYISTLQPIQMATSQKTSTSTNLTRSPSYSFMESHVSSPHVSAPMLTATCVGTSGAQLTTTATLSAPQVSSTVSSRVPPNATHSNPDVLWRVKLNQMRTLIWINFWLPSGVHDLWGLSSNWTISITEQLVRTFDPTMVTKARSRLDTRLPIGTTVLSVFQSLESVNKTIPKRGDMWKVPKDFAESKLQERNYKPPIVRSIQPGMNSLRTAPLTSGFLFGGRIQEAITADKDNQLHASLARNNSGQHQGAFKQPSFRPPAVPAPKKAKRNNLFSERPAVNPRSGPNRPSSYNRPSFSKKFSEQTQAGSEEFQTFCLQGRPYPFYLHNLRCRKYQSGPDFFIFQTDGFKLLQTHGFILW
ncbi:hypothetical protein DPMN_032863 [Dreissena polymorpha]|uniref:Uncharacterized protein n=1 Tax=Dreissena polymorpha TaxID=45954 RepID=A0A9D4M3S8_DREPO|nr:hypothetical protein DPMN_032863 [Dreissena polymorpha]